VSCTATLLRLSRVAWQSWASQASQLRAVRRHRSARVHAALVRVGCAVRLSGYNEVAGRDNIRLDPPITRRARRRVRRHVLPAPAQPEPLWYSRTACSDDPWSAVHRKSWLNVHIAGIKSVQSRRVYGAHRQGQVGGRGSLQRFQLHPILVADEHGRDRDGPGRAAAHHQLGLADPVIHNHYARRTPRLRCRDLHQRDGRTSLNGKRRAVPSCRFHA